MYISQILVAKFHDRINSRIPCFLRLFRFKSICSKMSNKESKICARCKQPKGFANYLSFQSSLPVKTCEICRLNKNPPKRKREISLTLEDLPGEISDRLVRKDIISPCVLQEHVDVEGCSSELMASIDEATDLGEGYHIVGVLRGSETITDSNLRTKSFEILHKFACLEGHNYRFVVFI